jgi:hypothetical protein
VPEVMLTFDKADPAEEFESVTPPVMFPFPSAVNTPPRNANPEPEPCSARKTYFPFKLALPNSTVIGAEAVNALSVTEVAITVIASFGGDNGAV